MIQYIASILIFLSKPAYYIFTTYKILLKQRPPALGLYLILNDKKFNSCNVQER